MNFVVVLYVAQVFNFLLLLFLLLKLHLKIFKKKIIEVVKFKVSKLKYWLKKKYKC